MPFQAAAGTFIDSAQCVNPSCRTRQSGPHEPAYLRHRGDVVCVLVLFEGPLPFCPLELPQVIDADVPRRDNAYPDDEYPFASTDN